MVEEFLEKLPEIDTRYEVSTKRFALFSCSPHIEKSGSQAGAQLLFRASNSSSSHLLDILSSCCLPAVCFAVQITFPNKHLHYADSPQRVELSQAKPSQA